VYDYDTYKDYFELDAYQSQMKHSSWSKTTSDFKLVMLSNADGHLSRLKKSKHPATQKAYHDYAKFFNLKR
jgi:hypothetical protein